MCVCVGGVKEEQGPGTQPPARFLPTALGHPRSPTSRRDTSMSTAKLVMWLHWQLTWLSLRKTTSQPRADQPPVPLTLREEGRVREAEGWAARSLDSWSKTMG